MSSSHGTTRKVYSFLAAEKADLDVRVQDSVITSTLADGCLRFSAAGAGSSTVDLADNGVPKALLRKVDFLFKTDLIDSDLDIRMGVASAYNVDPDVIPEVALFKIRGTGVSNAHSVYVETRDSVRDLKGTLTDKQVALAQWHRYSIDFATGTQSISVPGKSKGGYGSVRFIASRESSGKVFASPVGLQQIGKHMDMDDSNGPFQPFFQVRLVGAPDATVTVDLKEIGVEYLTH